MKIIGETGMGGKIVTLNYGEAKVIQGDAFKLAKLLEESAATIRDFARALYGVDDKAPALDGVDDEAPATEEPK